MAFSIYIEDKKVAHVENKRGAGWPKATLVHPLLEAFLKEFGSQDEEQLAELIHVGRVLSGALKQKKGV